MSLLTEKTEEITLEAETELRIKIESKHCITVQLKVGNADVFGTELIKEKLYTFHQGAKVAIFTFEGCVLMLKGKLDEMYVSKKTPMIQYFNTHIALEQLRSYADENAIPGPIVMVVGPQDVGKSTLCQILLNYAVRMRRRPIYVDIDVCQGSIAYPGTIAALVVTRPATIKEGFSENTLLVFNFGHISPDLNNLLYSTLVKKIANLSLERLERNNNGKSSGIIINTCGWVEGVGYKNLLHASQAFKVDFILVLGQERLYNELLRDIPNYMTVILLPKSDGVVERTKQLRRKNREQRTRAYFYGLCSPLYPYSFNVKWSDIQIYKIGAAALPTSCMPMGMTAENNMIKIVRIQPSAALLHHILAVSFAETSDDIILTNILGFICFTNIDIDQQTITVLSPQPEPLKNNVLILSDVQFVDNNYNNINHPCCV